MKKNKKNRKMKSIKIRKKSYNDNKGKRNEEYIKKKMKKIHRKLFIS